jgi:hypothetical protein
MQGQVCRSSIPQDIVDRYLQLGAEDGHRVLEHTLQSIGMLCGLKSAKEQRHTSH